MGALSVTVDAHTVPVVVTLVGELDLATATGLRLALENVLADSPASVVIDLAALGFIDASGLAVLATARQALRLRGGELVVRHPSPTLRKMLTITSLAAMVQETPESTVERT
jgi:stage II sporulation protein AA (anti-sigma F factor antagonist)